DVSVINAAPGGGTATLTAAFTVVNPATSTTVTTSGSPSTYGQSVTFTATVTSVAGTPTGSVTLYDSASCGVNPLTGSLILNGSGQAAFSTASLNAGTHNVLACYTHTGIFLDSNGNVSQVVNKATPTVAVSFAASPIPYDGDPHPASVVVTGVNSTVLGEADGT